ncbi:acyl carrier protein [Candidatus Manganitrophus noduliformans]|uniref:Acyl carrier protein n=1 Tax=Candidatus Manganitrophus noduliformans TaxID=2606439 RepID=A0A7X6ID69_9BACT|nr:phosphopantetheine-binding protein [Candidatus Manganitrophus noduliformans]NKE73255.1 acyl carrier protein [Candidatus Manganitrophus noduliformans]
MTAKRTREEIKEIILKALGGIAPEADLTQLKPDLNFREQLDIDSMDLLNIMIALHQTFEVEIPEADYPQLTTLNGAIEYLASRIENETT